MNIYTAALILFIIAAGVTLLPVIFRPGRLPVCPHCRKPHSSPREHLCPDLAMRILTQQAQCSRVSLHREKSMKRTLVRFVCISCFETVRTGVIFSAVSTDLPPEKLVFIDDVGKCPLCSKRQKIAVSNQNVNS